jgi:predicted membrane-bound spermidine synthase/tetratricopeptide (TPR) repeat protein
MSRSSPTRSARRALAAAIFLSGLAGLMHEIVWSKLLVSLIGSTAHAQVVVLTVFMGGLALGSFFFGGRSDRREKPLATYSRLEFLIAGYGLVLPFLLRAAGIGYEALATRFMEHGAELFALRFVLALLSVLLPAIWMGGTLPIVARFLVVRVESTRGAVAGLYALNNLGAVLGAWVAGFWTLEAFGIYPSLCIASAMNVAAGCIALMAGAPARESSAEKASDSSSVSPESRDGEDSGAMSQSESTPSWLEPNESTRPQVARVAPEPVVAIEERYGRAQYATTLAALFASGIAAMGYEVLFTRIIALAFGSSTHSFTVMVMSFVVGIGSGSAIVSRARVRRPLWLFGASQLAAAVALVAMTPLLSRLPYWIGLLRIDLGTEGSAFALYQAGKAGLILLFLLAPTICIGFGFPLVAQIQARSPEKIGAAVGSSYAWNTIGNVLGVVLTGLWLLPALGVAGAFHVHLALNVAAGAMVLAVSHEIALARRVAVAVAGAAALLVYALLGAHWIDPINRASDHLRMISGPDPNASALLRERHPASSFEAWKKQYVKLPDDFPLYRFDEDANATVLAYGSDDGVVLTVNTKPDATSFANVRGSDISTQMLLAHLPLLFAKGNKNVLVIGHGSGITAGSAMLHGEERGDVVEISRGVLEADALFAKDNHRVLSDPRVHVWQEDGRTFLRTAPWPYDAIISEPSNPWIAGIGGLFTRECFEEARARLAPGGVLCVWFHEYEQSDESIQLVMRTLQSVFPHCVLFEVLRDGDVIALASESPLDPDFARMEALFDRPELRRDLARMQVFDLASLFLFHAVPENNFAVLAGTGPINTDGHQRLEYMAAKAQFAHQNSSMVWSNHCLIHASGAAGEGMLDRYARWREQQGDPISREEWQAVRRRVLRSVDELDGKPILDALAKRIDSARPRSSPPKSTARGAEPELGTMSYMESNDRGVELMNAGDLDGAIRCWRHAVELDPKGPYAIGNLALGLRQKGQLPEAAHTIEAGIAASPKSAFLYPLAAQIVERAGDVDRARALLEKGVELDPDNTALLSQLALALIKANQVDRAIQCYERALALEPDSWQSAAMLAQLLARAPEGRVRAQLVIEEALRFHPDQPELAQVRDMINGQKR